MSRVHSLLAICVTGILGMLGCTAHPETIIIQNNHDLRYHGPIIFESNLPDGMYDGEYGTAQVINQTAYVIANVQGRSQIRLVKQASKDDSQAVFDGVFSVRSSDGALAILENGNEVARIGLGLVVIPGKNAATDQAVEGFKQLHIDCSGSQVLTAKTHSSGYNIEVKVTAFGGGWFDMDASLTRTNDEAEPAYVALVRRMTTREPTRIRTCYAGMVRGLDEPKRYHRNLNMTHGLDWCSWKSGNLWFLVVNGFTAGLTHEETPGRWIAVNSYYVQENVRKQNENLYFVSRIAGPSPEQELTSRSTSPSYVQPRKGEPLHIRWRIAVARHPEPGWQHSQTLVHSGFMRVTQSGEQAVVDLGVPYVEFGTSYFPYSTFCENFDYYRVVGLDREGWWPVSAKLWEHWRQLVPQMQTDLRIIKAMGFDWVRLHHLELLGALKSEDALGFLDFYMAECRRLGLKVLVDTAGTVDWFKTLASRYGDVVQRVELENEILIPGIKPGDPERWTMRYKAVKEVNPNIQVFLTGNCNVGMFERLLQLGVPFDRCGFHFYQHGPEMDWATPSVALAMAGYTRTIKREPTLGEFNWKILTRWSPESRVREFARIYSGMLEPRAIPEVMQFHWQETLSVNPRITRQGIRHYETIHLDRRPKPEAIRLMRLIQRYARPDSPVRCLAIVVENATFEDGQATAAFSITNKTDQRIRISLAAEAFGDINAKLAYPATMVLAPGETRRGLVRLSLAKKASPGTYHFFLKAEYTGGPSYGWGIASNPGSPSFDDIVLPELVEYPQGADVVKQFDYTQPITVTYGKDASVQELEMAYQVFNTLQAATGWELYLCSLEDLSLTRRSRDNLIVIGTPQTNSLIAGLPHRASSDKGLIILHDAGNNQQWLVLTGDTKESVAAAATDFTLRYWKNAKDSMIRIAGMEKGAALGNRAKPGGINLP